LHNFPQGVYRQKTGAGKAEFGVLGVVFLGLLFGVCQPVVEVFGQYLDVFFGHYVVDYRSGDFEFDQCLLHPLPQPVSFGVGLGQIQLADQLTQLREHYGIKIAIVVRYYALLIFGVFPFGHSRLLVFVKQEKQVRKPKMVPFTISSVGTTSKLESSRPRCGLFPVTDYRFGLQYSGQDDTSGTVIDKRLT
jgi:hypothetical protein